ncbi:ATP-dependent helicase [Priestia megaterium]|uniref:ATP-dependent helicase n=1 Tax=Priestia megaterium TaxID=1404 RepID=UPI0021F4CCD1|nr:ATP-dependent helicase [Priestia megaterium]UYP07265.1 ATP-dependent helicase [Priestia megaterium]
MERVLKITLEELFSLHNFTPNEGQREAIESLQGPLFLIAGPGSGKTRVLLWRTVNAIVFHNVSPEKIFLSTFTEKAAKQLRDGLQTILGSVTNRTGIHFDISRMYVGTIHSLCQRIIGDRRFIRDRARVKPPILLDELDQYFYINSRSFWKIAEELIHISEEDIRFELKQYFGKVSTSRHDSTQSLISIFNRFSEENLNIENLYEYARDTSDESLLRVTKLYEWYKQRLFKSNMVDFSLLQQRATNQIMQSEDFIHEFEHVIIDEYQDTNSIQEQLFFRLASGRKNLCVVGDDDQALYRFRGATVENFVQFPQRCELYLNASPQEIKLNINYRSQRKIVDTYTGFIEKVNWKREDGEGYYRLHDKEIQANSKDLAPSVLTTTCDKSDVVSKEVSLFVRKLIDEKKVEDPNQIAFLFPALKNNKHVQRMKRALEKEGIKVYAPRAGRFLEVEEAKALFGLLIKIIGKPKRQDFSGSYKDYHNWLDNTEDFATSLVQQDERLGRYVESKVQELSSCKEDYIRLLKTLNDNNWSLHDVYIPKIHKRSLVNTSLLSTEAIRGLGTDRLDRIIEQRNLQGKPFTLQYILNRATSVDWNILDLFYRLSGFPYFSQMFKLAENGEDEGPICNLSMISEYLSRYMEQTRSVITGARLIENHLRNDFFGRYVYGLFRVGESEVENKETPFPKGRVPFLTIHQSKGLEFPYVVLGSIGKKNKGVPRNEEIVRPLIKVDNEPLEQIPQFDTMRLFYVALSRAEKGLVITQVRGQGRVIDPAFKQLFMENDYPTIENVNINSLPNVQVKEGDIPKVYSYTSDFLTYLKCPRNYMVFNKYRFVPSRSQTMLFGNLVHQTIEDIHNRIISLRGDRRSEQ